MSLSLISPHMNWVAIEPSGLKIDGEFAENVGVIIGVDRLLDMMRTVVNVTGDGMVTTVVAKSEGLLNEDIFNEVSDRDEYSSPQHNS